MQERNEERYNLAVVCGVRSQVQQTERAIVIPKRAVMGDLSIAGCSIESTRLPLSANDHVLLGVGSGQPIEAEVKWARNGRLFGLRFLQPLDRTQIDGIAKAKTDNRSGRVKAPLNLRNVCSRLRSVCA